MDILEFVKPICLPYEDDANEDYYTSDAMKHHEFWVAGWGATTARGNYSMSPNTKKYRKMNKKNSKFWPQHYSDVYTYISKGSHHADILQHVKLDIFDAEKCKDVYQQVGTLNQTIQLCVGGEEGKDSCGGDSGSALMTARTEDEASMSYSLLGTWKIVGVVSFGPSRCGIHGVPGVYTKIRHYIEWILDNVEIWFVTYKLIIFR